MSGLTSLCLAKPIKGMLPDRKKPENFVFSGFKSLLILTVSIQCCPSVRAFFCRAMPECNG